LKELAAPDVIDRLTPSAVVLLARSLGSADARGAAVQLVRKAQLRHPDDFWTNVALADVLSQEPATRAEGIGFCRAALACRPHNFTVHLFLARALQEQGKLHQAAEVVRRAIQLRPESAWGPLLLGDVLLCLDRGPEALAEYRRAVQLKSRQGPPTQADADQLRRVERLVELDGKLPAVLRGEVRPRDAAERAEYAFVCHVRQLYAAGARLYGEAFGVQPELARQHRYHAALASALAGTGTGKDAGGLDERQRARLRAQARAWLRDEMDVWRRRAKEPGGAGAFVLPLIDCWLRDPDLACLRDPGQMGRLPAAERREWERLWRELRELRASARGTKQAGRRPS
jgi:tetratricopeptide (TPR) repeat protein